MLVPHDADDPALHEELRQLNEARLRPTLAGLDDERPFAEALAAETTRRAREHAFLEARRAAIAARAAAAPTTPDAFVAWFERLRVDGPGQHDALFPYLATDATLAEVRWFLTQEVAGEAGFDDLVALTQLRMPERAKLELARNYWDEMGRGQDRAMHGPMLARLAADLALDRATPIVPEAIALGNLLAGLAANRRYAFHAVGALGVVELTAPDRARLVNLGLKRLGVGAGARQYYALHATVDVRHSEAWNAEVIAPLVAAQPACARAIAEGALMRLTAGARCFARYRRELGLGG